MCHVLKCQKYINKMLNVGMQTIWLKNCIFKHMTTGLLTTNFYMLNLFNSDLGLLIFDFLAMNGDKV